MPIVGFPQTEQGCSGGKKKRTVVVASMDMELL
jgi:hypothetical protein